MSAKATKTTRRKSKRRARKGGRRLSRAHNRRLGKLSRLTRSRWWWIRPLLLVLGGAALGGVVTAALGYHRFQDQPAPAGGPPVAVGWPEGLDAEEAAALLGDLGLTDSPAKMELFLRATASIECLKPGPHLLPQGVTPRQLIATLCRDPERGEVKVTFPEGFHRFAIAKRLEDKGVTSRAAFLHATADWQPLYRLGVEPAEHPVADTAEGYLFPATYKLKVNSEPTAVVERLVGESNRRWAKLVVRHAAGWERLQSELDFSRREVLTLASMVEKEAAVAEERPLIASVFLNRLMSASFRRLQSDPTAVYGCYAMPEQIPACEGFSGVASGAINRDEQNLYSTYVTEDLPPGPVANPGEASIAAVLAPADTSYFYFVASGGRRHEFSETYKEHLEAVQRLREKRR